jgi:hypothetical protein
VLCIDPHRSWLRRGLAVLVFALAGCASRPQPPVAPAPGSVAAPAPGLPPPATSARPAAPGNAGAAAQAVAPVTPAAPAATAAARAAAPKPPPRYVKLGPPVTPRSWDELRLQAAQRLVASHPDTSYVAPPPSILLAIPILEVELNADGSVRHINVMRVPGQAQDTTQLAIDAIRRAAPFGDVSRLKKPWKFIETFLFDDDRRFMPRTLDR